VISEYLASVVRCPACQSEHELIEEDGGLRCTHCSAHYLFHGDRGFIDLRPPAGTFGELTEYAEEEFHHREGPLRPPLLSARVKIDQMSQMLALSQGDRVLDIGCGNGRAVVFKRPSVGQMVAIDAGDHFAPEALATVDLSRGDIRRLPFQTDSFDKAYSLDVLEHLTEEGVRAMLSEARRVLRPGGQLFVYSHVMMSSKLASFQRGVNRLVRWLDKRGLVDNQPERDRKSDHLNALTSYDLLEKLVDEAGFHIEKIRYYNVVFKAVIEDLLLPIVEQNIYKRRPLKTPSKVAGDPSSDEAPSRSARPNVGRWAHGPLLLATALMKLDVELFGGIRTGPFFLLLRTTENR
jgi:ubiquinone/menaquinone biosynthesis C-methylase UbiE